LFAITARRQAERHRSRASPADTPARRLLIDT